MKACQSCGMPLSEDSQGGGTNADGSKNKKHCVGIGKSDTRSEKEG